MIFSFDQLNAPTYMESLLLKWARELPTQERGKLLDLLHRFSMARQYTGEIKFDFQWLLAAETEYDPLVDPAADVLAVFQNKVVSS